MEKSTAIKSIVKEFRHNKTLYFMLSPAILFFIFLSYIPMAGIVMAFKEYNAVDGIFFSPWVGLENFRFLFITDTIGYVIRNTALYNLSFIIVGNILQVIVAILLSELISKTFRKITQSFMLLPYFISWVIVAGIAYNLFNYETGTMNSFLSLIGQEKINVYNRSELWKYIILVFFNWKAIGYGSVLYLAAIMGMDTEINEAAYIDGANSFQKIYYIVLPHLVPTLITLVLLSVGQIFRGNFQMFYQLVGSNGLLYKATDVIEVFVVRSLLESNDIGMASAAAFMQSILCFLTITVVNGIVKRLSPENSLY